MTQISDDTKSQQIEREIAEDRRRIEDRIDAIQQKMSPGQMVDEVLAFAKTSGGGQYASNLGAAVKNNPIPLALMGISLAWLMAGPKNSSSATVETASYPLAPVRGQVRRMGPAELDGDQRYSHFTDDSGSRFKALTDQTGKRAGHFIDEAGKTFRGFADASGKHISDVRDEAGTLFDDASGWLSHTWHDIRHSTGKLSASATDAGRSALDSSSRLNDAILKHFKDQPLVGGALAFAVGAAIGSALPHTRMEDEILGEASEQVRGRISKEAEQAIDKGEAVATDLYDRAVSVATDVHDEARDRISQEANSLRSEAENSKSES